LDIKKIFPAKYFEEDGVLRWGEPGCEVVVGWGGQCVSSKSCFLKGWTGTLDKRVGKSILERETSKGEGSEAGDA
jgi:hypothetical protein